VAKDGGIIGLGIFILVISIIGYNIPSIVTEADPNTTLTIPVAVGICNSGMDQLGQAFSAEAVKICSEWNISLYGIYGVGVSGVILMIVGAVVPSKSKKEKLTCSYCNFVAMSEAELLKHNSENHLDKSQYVCEHCDFVGFTEEILWNHYDDKHPDKKKWKYN